MKKNYKLIILIVLIILPLFLNARHNARVKPYPERKIFSYEIQGDTHWLGMGKGIVKYDAVTDSVLHITEAAGYELGVVKDIAVADSNLVWFVANDSLLLTYDGKSWFDKTDELNIISTGTLGHLVLDEIGILWLVKGRHLLKYYNNTWEIESDSFPLNGQVTDIVNINGDIWVRSKNEFAVFKDNKWHVKILDDYYIREEESYRFVTNEDDELFSIYNQEIFTIELNNDIDIIEFGERDISSFIFNSSGDLIISASYYEVNSYILSVYKNKKHPVYITDLYLQSYIAAPVLYNEKDGFMWLAIQGELHKCKNKKIEIIKLWRDTLDILMNNGGKYWDLQDHGSEGPSIKGEGQIIDNQEEGFWQYKIYNWFKDYRPEPKLYKEGKYMNGLREGVWRNYSEYGRSFNTETYRNGYRDGETLFYNADSLVIKRGTYHKDKKQGKWEEFNYDGDLIAFKNFDNNLMHGSYRKIFGNGCYKTSIYERGELVSDWKVYNKNGIEIYSEDNPNLIKPPLLKNGEKKNGIRITLLNHYFQITDNYQKAIYYRSVRYENDLPATKAREYLINGTLCSEGSIISENPIRYNGKVTFFDRDGKVMGESNYLNGRKEGKCITFMTKSFRETRAYEHASYYRIAKYKHGSPIGKVKDYFLDGILQFVGRLNSEFPSSYDGIVKLYSSNGELRRKVKYKNGKQVRVIKHYINED